MYERNILKEQLKQSVLQTMKKIQSEPKQTTVQTIWTLSEFWCDD